MESVQNNTHGYVTSSTLLEPIYITLAWEIFKKTAQVPAKCVIMTGGRRACRTQGNPAEIGASAQGSSV